MNGVRNPSAAEILNALYTDLTSWCAENGGVCEVSRGLDSLIQMLSNSPSAWRAILHWQGDAPLNDQPIEQGVLSNRLLVTLDGDLGPTMTPGQALFQGTDARPTAWLDTLRLVRDRIRAYRFTFLPPPNDRFRYEGCDDAVPVAPGTVAGYVLRFRLLTTIDSPRESITLQA